MTNKAVKFDIKAHDDFSLAFNKVKQEMNHFSRVIDKVKNKNNQLKNSNTQLDDSYKKVSNSVSKYKAALVGIASSLIIRDFVDTALAVEKTDRTFKAIFKSSKRVKEEMSFVKNTAKSLGLDLSVLSTEYAKLSAASNGTTLAGDKTRKIFLAISKASVTLGMSADETSGAFRAIQQMISKGKVQAEELRGQLGERLPGAFQIAARSLGLTTAELDKFLSTGKITAEDLLPALADELEKTFGEGAESAIDSTQAKINNLKTTLYELKKDLIKAGLIEVFKDIAIYSASFAKNMIIGIKEIQKIKKNYFPNKKDGTQKPKGSLYERLEKLKKERDNLDYNIKRRKNYGLINNDKTISLRRTRAGKNVEIGLLENKISKLNSMRSMSPFLMRAFLEGSGKENNKVLKKTSSSSLIPKDSNISFKKKMERITREKEAIKQQEKAKKEALALDKKLYSEANRIILSYDTQTERLQKKKERIQEIYKLNDTKGNKFLSESNYKKTITKIDLEIKKESQLFKNQEKAKKKALTLDKKLHSEANRIVSSYETQVQQLQKQKDKINEIYKLRDSKGNPFISEDDFKKTMNKIDSEMDRSTNTWKSHIKSFEEISKDSFLEIKNGISDMLKEGEFSLGKLGDLLKSTFLNKAIDASVNAGMDSLFGGLFKNSSKQMVTPTSSRPTRSKSRTQFLTSQDSNLMLSSSKSNSDIIIHQNIHLTPNVEQTIAVQMQRYLPTLSEHAVMAVQNAQARGMI
ncbi:MAG: hypothetical protein COB02_13785 [Candidatus Cloacimonadota bacterium]|nr:MAG: hypothetical protein COB02_13785 [Candidatus Cloacimonadota bacterium]